MSSSGTHEIHVATCDWVEIQGVIHGGHLECDMWQVRGQVLLTHLDQIGGEKRRRGREESKPRKEREKRRDFRVRSPYFSLSFRGDRTDGFRWSKGKSSSSRQGLRIKTGVGEFRQTPRGRGFFSYLV